jgi:hypothetical protein
MSLKNVAILRDKNYHGGCEFIDCNPPILLENRIKNIYFNIPFDQANKLLLSIESLMHHLNRYNRKIGVGKERGLRLTFHLDNKRISILDGKMSVVLPVYKAAYVEKLKRQIKELKKRIQKIPR